MNTRLRIRGIAVMLAVLCIAPFAAAQDDGDGYGDSGGDGDAGLVDGDVYTDAHTMPIAEGENAYLLYYDEATWEKFRARASGDGYPRPYARLSASFGFANMRQADGRFFQRVYGSAIGGELNLGLSLNRALAFHVGGSYHLFMTNKAKRSTASPQQEVRYLTTNSHIATLGAGATLQHHVLIASFNIGAGFHQEGKRWGPGGNLLFGFQRELGEIITSGIALTTTWAHFKEKSGYLPGGAVTFGLCVFLAY